MKAFEFPQVGRPTVSIVIPTHGGWEWTSRALTAVLEHTDPAYELIIYDNASGDETPEQLAAVQNARIVLSPENHGYGAACNRGAALARAPYLVFLNSDAFVHERWLGSLLEPLERDPSVGAIGPRLLNLDGTLQEAGSTVLGDAMTVRHGDGDAPDASAFAFPRAVDYVSGACLVTRRSTFHEAGGFDSAFGLGYYEDVDFCFRLRALGYRVLYEPRAVVTHVRGASGSDVVHELFARNHRLFLTRWKRVLPDRPPSRESDALGSTLLRDLVASDRILVVGGERQARASQLVERLVALAPDARVTLLGAAARVPDAVEQASADDEASWLRERRFLYDTVVLVGLGDAARLATALSEEQPQALLVFDLDTEDLADADPAAAVIICTSEDALAFAGRLVPDTPAFHVATGEGDENDRALRDAFAVTGTALAA